MSTVTWVLEGSGVSATVVLNTETGDLTITNTGSVGFDANALWFASADVALASSFTTLVKSDNSLNMNGTGVSWDDYVKLSSTGLGSEGTDKDTYLTENEILSTNVFDSLDASFFQNLDDEQWALVTLGLRATSVDGGSTSVKLVATTGAVEGGGDNTLPDISGGPTTTAQAPFYRIDDADGIAPLEYVVLPESSFVLPTAIRLSVSDPDNEGVVVTVNSVTAAINGGVLPGNDVAGAEDWLGLSDSSTGPFVFGGPVTVSGTSDPDDDVFLLLGKPDEVAAAIGSANNAYLTFELAFDDLGNGVGVDDFYSVIVNVTVAQIF